MPLDKEKLKKAIATGKVTDKQTLAVFLQNEELKQEIDTKIADLSTKVDEAVKNIKENEVNLPEVLKAVKGQDGKTPTEEEILNLIKPLIPEPIKGEDGKTPIAGVDFPLPKNGIDGKNADENKIIEKVLTRIPIPENGLDGINGKDGSPDTRTQIVEKINSGRKNELKISYKQIEGITKTTDDLDRAISILDQRTQYLINKTTQSGGNGAVSVTTPLTGDGSTGTPLGIQQATVFVDGYISAVDFTTFNNKLDSVSVDGVTITGDGTPGSPLVAVGGAASLVVGSSTITSGTDTRILYDNAGTLGEYTISGSGTVVAMATAPTFGTSITGSYLNISQILITDGSKNIVSADTATYPSLTELTYLKGVTSAIQTQLNAKGTGTVTAVSIASANGFAGSSSGGATPALTISTSITGILKGNGTAISAATAGSDYAVGSIGLAGGQTIAGSTLTTENLTLRANAADLTTGAVIVTSSKEATSSTVGSVQLAGGLAVAKRVFALDMTVTNTITGSVSGNAGTASAVAVGGITGLGTGVATALAVNVGSAGAFITFNGDAGTPSALVGTNISGTAASLTAGNATLAATVASANEATDTTCFILFQTASGTTSLATKNNTGLTYNSNTNAVGATTFVGALTGNASTASSAAILTNTRTIWGQNFNGSANVTGDITLGTASITMTGSIAATGARVTKGWFTDLESTNMPTVGGTVILTSLTAPQFTTIELGAATDTTISRVSAGVIAVEGSTVALASNKLSFFSATTSAELAGVISDETGSGKLMFGTSPTIDTLPVLSAGTLMKYTVASSDGTATGDITDEFNSGYSSTAIGDLVYLDSSATWQKADADLSAAAYSSMLGIALEVKASGAAVKVLLRGFIYAATPFPTFTIGAPIFMSATAGAVTQTAPVTTDSATRVVGYAVHADKLWFCPSNDWATHT